MKQFIILLDEYFDETQKYYYFFDGLFKEKGGNKTNALHRIGISDSSYRTERLKKNVKNENISMLLKHFNYNYLNYSNKNAYEICLSKTYYSGFYRQIEELELLIEELDTYILENNYLKPLFILFKCYAYMHFDVKYSTRKDLLKDELKYLENFSNDYFTKELNVIYQVVMMFFGNVYNKSKLESEIIVYSNLRWLYYNFKAHKLYFMKNDLEAILYFQEAYREFEKLFNIERAITTVANISLIYNTLGKYLFSLERLEEAVTYAHSSKNELWIRSITQHYLYSNYMLKRYKEILNFYEIIIFEPSKLNSVSSVICILAAYKLNCLHKAKEIMDYHINDINVKVILEYIECKERNVEVLRNILLKLRKTEYFAGIVKTLR